MVLKFASKLSGLANLNRTQAAVHFGIFWFNFGHLYAVVLATFTI